MLTAVEINAIIEEFKPYSPKKIGVFGSFARGEDTENSDVDLLYDFEDGITLFQLAKLKVKLEARLNKEIDLVSADYLSKYLKESILGEVKYLFET